MKCFSPSLLSLLGRLFCLFPLLACTHKRLADRLFLLSQTTPVIGQAESIGSYSLGCLRGAISLPAQGEGFVVMHTARGRFWGHPLLTTLIQDMGEQWSKESNSLIVVGDLSHARGGPMLSNHMSHQNGLDVDLWLQMAPLKNKQQLHWTLGERETISAKSVVSDNKKNLRPELWGREQMKLLELAANDERVSRIFVHPLIKKNICHQSDIAKKDWIKKIRPWWGHDDHIHVRLKCPADSPTCEQQDEVTSFGCDETLDWWFSDEAKVQKVSTSLTTADLPNLGEIYLEQVAKLPLACQSFLEKE